MAAPVVESLTPTEFDSTGATRAVPMPATVNAGDLLLMFYAQGPATSSGNNTTTATPSGWTLISTTAVGGIGACVRGSVFAKVAAGTEGGTTVNVVPGESTRGCAVHVYRISGWEGTLANGVVNGTPATGTSTGPNPPSASWTWGTTDVLIIAGAHPSSASSGTLSVSAYPSGYTDGAFNVGFNIFGAAIGTARRSETASSSPEDPGAYTISASRAWVATTVVVRGVSVQTVTPSPVAVGFAPTTPAALVRTRTVTPSPVTIPLALPAPVVTNAERILPNAVAIPLVVPAPTVVAGAATLTPDPVAVPFSPVAPTVTAGAITLTPDPVEVPLALPEPLVFRRATITVSALTEGADTSLGDSATTDSISPAADTLLLAWVLISDWRGGSGEAEAPTSLTGNGLTWVKIADVTFDFIFHNLSVWRAMGAAPTSGAVTIQMPDDDQIIQWAIDQYSGVDITGSDGENAVVQAVVGSSPSITLDPFESATNAAVGGWGSFTNPGTKPVDPGTGFTELHDLYDAAGADIGRLNVEAQTTEDTSVDIDGIDTSNAGIALEIKSGIDTGAQIVTPSPVTIPLALPAPTVASTLTLIPDAVAVPFAPVVPTVVAGALTATPDPVAVPFATAAPTVVPGEATIAPDPVAVPFAPVTPSVVSSYLVTPDAVAVPLVIPDPAVTATRTVAPDPVEVPFAPVAPTLVPGATTLAPDPVAVPLVLPDPTVTTAVTLTPDPVAVAFAPVDPTVQAVYTATPDPVAVPFAPVDPTVVPGAATLAPDAVAVPLVVPPPTMAAGAVSVAPDPVAVPFITVAPTLAAGAATLTPDPVAVPFVPVAPTVVSQNLITPDPVVVPFVTVAPTVVPGVATLAPDAVAIVLVVPDVSVFEGQGIQPASVAIVLVLPDPTVVAGAVTLTPDPVAIGFAPVAPNVVQVITPAPVEVPFAPVDPSVVSSYTAAPDPVAVPLAIPEPTVVAEGRALPDPVEVPLVIPTPTVVQTGADQTLTPDSVAVPFVTVTPLLIIGARTVTPGAVAILLVIPDPLIAAPQTLAPDPVVMLLVLPTPTIIGGGVVPFEQPDTGVVLWKMIGPFEWMASAFIAIPEPPPEPSGYIAPAEPDACGANLWEMY